MRYIVFISVLMGLASCDSSTAYYYEKDELSNTSFEASKKLIDGSRKGIVHDSQTDEKAFFFVDLGKTAVAIVKVTNFSKHPLNIKVFDESRKEYEGPVSSIWEEKIQYFSTLLEGGKYYFRIGPLNSDNNGVDFLVELSLDRSDEFEFNNVISKATEISKETIHFPTFRPAGDIDFFRFEHDGGNLSLKTTYAGYVFFRLFNENGLELESGQISCFENPENTQTLSFGALNQGFYILSLASSQDWRRAFGYQFQLH